MKHEDQSKRELSKEKINEIKRNISSVQEKTLHTMQHHECKYVEDYFSKHFSTAGGEWQFDSRDAVVKALGSGDYKYESIKSDVKNVEVLNDCLAVVSERRAVSASINGKDFSSEFNNKTVYTLEDGRWKALLWAVTC